MARQKFRQERPVTNSLYDCSCRLHRARDTNYISFHLRHSQFTKPLRTSTREDRNHGDKRRLSVRRRHAATISPAKSTANWRQRRCGGSETKRTSSSTSICSEKDESSRSGGGSKTTSARTTRAKRPQCLRTHTPLTRNYRTTGDYQHRHNWARSSRKEYGGKGDIGCADCAFQERAGAKYHNQAWICKCENLQVRQPGMPSTDMLQELQEREGSGSTLREVRM